MDSSFTKTNNQPNSSQQLLLRQSIFFTHETSGKTLVLRGSHVYMEILYLSLLEKNVIMMLMECIKKFI